jgi:hypothetical protein
MYRSILALPSYYDNDYFGCRCNILLFCYWCVRAYLWRVDVTKAGALMPLLIPQKFPHHFGFLYNTDVLLRSCTYPYRSAARIRNIYVSTRYA